MSTMNTVFLLGNLTRDPELKHLPSGTAVATFGLATNRTYTGKDGKRAEEVCYVDIVVFGKQAETSTEYLKKGRQVLIEGRLQYRTWEDKDGSERSKHEVVADHVQFLGGPKANGTHVAEPGTDEKVPF